MKNKGLKLSQDWLNFKKGKYKTQDVFQALKPHISEQRLNKFQFVLDHRLKSVVLGVEDVHKEHNGAACIRSAEGLGIHQVVAAELRNAYPLGTQEPEKKQKIPSNVSMHSHRWIDFKSMNTGIEVINWAKTQGYRVYGAGPRGKIELNQIPNDQPAMILFGNEGRGLVDETMEACDEVFKIPMYGFTESFNLSVSVGMVLQDVCTRVRQRLAAQGLTGELSEEEKLYYLAYWSVRDLPLAEEILKRYLGDPTP